MLRIKVLLALSFLFLSSFMFLSCDLITDPERFADKTVLAPSFGTLEFNELVQGQHVDGTIRFSLDTIGQGFNVTGIGIFVDSQEYTRYSNISQILEIDTRRYSEGQHKVAVGFYQENPNHGLLNLFFIPSLYLETELVFDRTLPVVIPIICSDEENGYTRISWNESPNENFVKYEVLKSYDGTNWQTISTIKSRSTTSVIDSVDIVLNGIEVNYKLLHYTGFTFEKSNTVNYIVGDKIIYDMQTDISKRGLIANPSLNEVYFMIDRKIVSFSATDNSLKKELLLPEIPNGPPFASFAISDDGQIIYVYNNYGRKFYVINANQLFLNYTKRLNISEELRMESDEIIPIDENRVFLFGKYEKIRLVNFNQNVLLDSLVLPNAMINCVTVSSDKSKLFVAITENNSYKIQVRDINSNGFPIINEVSTEAPTYKLKVTVDGQKLIDLPSQSTKLNFRDINSLGVLGYLNSEQNQRINDFVYSINKIYICQNYAITFNGNPKSVFRVTRFDMSSLQQETSQYLTNIWQYNFGSSGNNIYAPTSGLLDQKNVIGIAIKN